MDITIETPPINCVELASIHARNHPEKVALWTPGTGGGTSVTYGELFEMAGRVQHYLIERGIKPGDRVLLVDQPGPRLYATVLGILGMGASVVLVEPWMPLKRIEEVVQTIRPAAFIGGLIGKAWGVRVQAIRRIKHWFSISQVVNEGFRSPFQAVSVAPDQPAIYTFTSGTTGNPRGVVRTHGFLADQHRVLVKALHGDEHTGPDLCIFANFTLANLASGRTTLLVPSSWKTRHLKQLDTLPESLHPQSLTCGPAFLLKLMDTVTVPTLRSIHVGGALTDCWIFEQGFQRWPNAEWLHVYGSTEAEPVAVCNAREAVESSRARGYFQTLFLGYPVDEIRHRCTPDGLWVTGPHVCPLYAGNDEANLKKKRIDDTGTVWHFMGDRVINDEADGGFWYGGRSQQSTYAFELEQEVYSKLQTSSCFIHTTGEGTHYLIGSVSQPSGMPDIEQTIQATIYRDRRHRARIDRQKSVERGASWLAS